MAGNSPGTRVPRLSSGRGAQGSAAGFVLIVVLVVTAALPAAVLAFHLALGRAVRWVEREPARVVARAAARSALELGRRVLADDDPAVDHLGERWAQPIALDLGEGLRAIGGFHDAESGFPLATLFIPGPQLDLEALARLHCLLDRLGAPRESVEQLDAELRLWARRVAGPGRGAGVVLEFPGEIAAVHSLSLLGAPGGAIGERWLSTRGGERVNVNTAPEEILRCLDGRLDDGWVRRVTEERAASPFLGIADLFRRVATAGEVASQVGVLLTTRSRAFRLRVEVEAAATTEGLEAWFERGGGTELAAAHWRRPR